MSPTPAAATPDGPHINPAVTAMIVVASIVLSITVLVCCSCFGATTVKVFGTFLGNKAQAMTEKLRKQQKTTDETSSTSSSAKGLARAGSPDTMQSLPDTASSSGTLIVNLNFDPEKVTMSEKMRLQLAKMKRFEKEP
ncbi:hypothetical protein BDR26DRAFT_1004396 [Obelidium mucronatum]|nr:hypothetical protein BDR26DRAFT_1004396 [Obelidium mucronatum]